MLDVAAGILGEAADVHFVDDGFGEFAAKVTIAFPVERVVDDDALGRADDAVVGVTESSRPALWRRDRSAALARRTAGPRSGSYGPSAWK